MVSPVSRRVRPFKGVAWASGGIGAICAQRLQHTRFFELVNLKTGHIFRDVYTLVLRGGGGGTVLTTTTT